MAVTAFRTRLPRRAALALVLTCALVGVRTDEAAAQAVQPCDIRTPERVVVVGDVHGAYDGFVAILREAGLVDARARWTGGRAVLVQTGDVLDRGPDSRKVMDLLRRLERDASRAGGRVWALLGNHEVMRMIGDWRYVSAGEFAAFRTADSRERHEAALTVASMNAEDRARREGRAFDVGAFREQFVKEIPLGYLEMRDAFSPQGEYGRWLRTHVAALKINGVLLVHGGVSPEVAPRGCAGINDAVAADLRVSFPPPAEGQALFSSQENGPLWYRGMTDQPGALRQDQVERVLTAVGAQTVVIGHTVTGSHRIESRYDGRVIQVDTGMLRAVYEGGIPAALEITASGMTALYAGRERHPVPFAASATSGR